MCLWVGTWYGVDVTEWVLKYWPGLCWLTKDLIVDLCELGGVRCLRRHAVSPCHVLCASTVVLLGVSLLDCRHCCVSGTLWFLSSMLVCISEVLSTFWCNFLPSNYPYKFHFNTSLYLSGCMFLACANHLHFVMENRIHLMKCLILLQRS